MAPTSLLLLAQADSERALRENAVEAGKRGFAEGSYPWYDAKTDSLYPIRFREPWFDWNWNWSGPWNWVDILEVLFWTGVAAWVVTMLYFVARYFRNQSVLAPALASKRHAPLQVDQIEALAFLAERPRGDLLGLARMHYENGNYSEAIIYLFSHQLVELDRAAMIRLAKGKTNRQYLRETSQVAPLRRLLEGTMIAFESVFFGRRPLDRRGFEVCWNELPQFDHLLRGDR